MFLLPLPSSLLQLPNVQPLKEDHSFFPGMGNNNFEWQGVGGMANQKVNYYFFEKWYQEGKTSLTKGNTKEK